MKRVRIALVLVLCLSLLAACGGKNPPDASGGDAPLAEPLDPPAALSPTGVEAEVADGQTFWTVEYDYDANKLVLTDISTGAIIASYTFDAVQTPMLMERTSGGAVMLSGQSAADIQTTNGVSVITGDNPSESLAYWRFDKEMNLLERYKLTDPALTEGLEGYTFAVSPDGGEIAYAVGDSLYRYTFETQALEEIAAETGETVYYEAIRYGTGGKHLAFFGSIADREGTAYGSIQLDNGTGKAFFADHFSGMTLTVNGEYAAIADTIPPNSMGGPPEEGSVLYLDLARCQGRRIAVESGAESGLVSVSADGRYVMTCRDDDGGRGVLRGYRAADGTRVIEQSYRMDVNCKPYQILVQGQSAYAVLGADNGKLLSPAVVLP